jgi:hypothetical protein
MDEVFQKNKYLFHVTLPRGLPIKIARHEKAQLVVVNERVTKHWACRERHQHAKKPYAVRQQAD